MLSFLKQIYQASHQKTCQESLSTLLEFFLGISMMFQNISFAQYLAAINLPSILQTIGKKLNQDFIKNNLKLLAISLAIH